MPEELPVPSRRHRGLEMAVRLARLGAWTITLQPLRFHPSREWRLLHDFPADAAVPLTRALRLVGPASRAELLARARAWLAGAGELDVRVPMRTATGRQVTVRIVGERQSAHDRPALLQGACQDITNEVGRENEAQHLLGQLAQTLDTMTDGVLSWDRDWKITYANAAALRMTGRTRAELLGMDFWTAFPEIDGTWIHAQYEAAWLEMQPRQFEFLYEPLQLWVDVRCFPAADHFTLYFQDITTRRNLQLELEAHRDALERRVAKRTEQLRRANEEIASVTTAIAHDVRTPLAAAGGFSHALRSRVQHLGDELALHYCGRIQEGIEQADALFSALLELLRLGQVALAPREVDLSDMARQWVRDRREKEPERRVEVTIQPGMHALADARLLQTLVDNLLGNAWKFTRRAEPAVISFSQSATGEFCVADNGAGFDMAHARELFAPFRRLHTETEFPGTGVGLASARRVVERHGGTMRAEASPGQGARFFFTLALADGGKIHQAGEGGRHRGPRG